MDQPTTGNKKVAAKSHLQQMANDITRPWAERVEAVVAMVYYKNKDQE